MINNIFLTSKYGLHAERTTLWALRVFPSAARVQSTSVPLSRSVSKFCMSVLWWLFHLRQNCWSSSMVVLASFPRFCTDEKTDVSNVGCMSTNKTKQKKKKKPDNVRMPKLADGVVLPFSLSYFLVSFLIMLSIDRATRRYVVLPRPIIIAHIEPDDVLAKVRLMIFVPFPTVPRLPFSSRDSPFFLARGPRGRTTETKAPQRSAEASKMAV